jgi:hypothetical protein
LAQKHLTMLGDVISIRIDDSFSVWEPMINYWHKDLERLDAYNFNSDDVWYGQGPKGNSISERLEWDCVNWQLGKIE